MPANRQSSSERCATLPRRLGRLIWRTPRLAAVAVVRGYQLGISPLLPLLFGPGCGCRFHPTCSHYAVEALRRHGLWAGAWLAVCRLVRCQPLHPGGADPVPSTFRWLPRSSRPTAPYVLPTRRVNRTHG